MVNENDQNYVSHLGGGGVCHLLIFSYMGEGGGQNLLAYSDREEGY